MDLHSLELGDLLTEWDKLDDGGRDLDAIRALVLEDRYYLLTRVCRRHDMLHPWIYARCREVEAEPDERLDLWAREHYKSTIITFAGCIQEVLKDPEITVGIFAHTRGIAQKFLRQVMMELQSNDVLKSAFPDVLYRTPEKSSPRWSLDNGLLVKRESNPKEATVEAWGLVDGQPTSAHFRLRIYDDVVTRESVTTPEQVKKTTEAWELSDNLGMAGGRRWHVGTRYSFADTYQSILDRGSLKPRIYPATVDGTANGEPVLLTDAEWEKKKRDQGEYTIACHAAGTRVLMADWTYKPIEDVLVGDEVVGFELQSGKGNKPLLKPTKVVAISRRISDINQYTLESGAKVRCTPDHKWWTRRSGCDTHRVYAPLGSGRKGELTALARVTDFPVSSTNEELLWQYLAGILDGEGTVSGNRIVITQSSQHNPEVHARIAEVLTALKLDFSTYDRPPHGNSKGSTLFLINGGRAERHRVLLLANPAKRRAIIDSLYGCLAGKGGTARERVVGIEPQGRGEVFNIQTATGNYIAEGYASKNCQMLQNPLSGQQATFKLEWLTYYEVRPSILTVAVMCDPARSKKKDSDNTAFAVIGIDSAMNKYLLDGFRHKMKLSERWEALKLLRRRWMSMPGVQIVKCGYEKFGAESDFDYFEEQMKREQLFFDIEELAWPREGGGSKIDRVQRLEPDCRNGRFLLPAGFDDKKITRNQKVAIEAGEGFRVGKNIVRRDENGRAYDLTFEFREEYRLFPFGAKKDLVDVCSRIYDMDLAAPVSIDEASIEPEYTED